MSQIEKAIGNKIEEIAHKRAGRPQYITTGTVVSGSIDEDAGTCTVVLISDDPDGGGTPGVVLNAVSMNSNGLLLYPADNSHVWVAELDGPGKWGLIKCSDLVKYQLTIGGTKLTVADGQTQWGDGSLGGMVKVEDIVTRLNNLERDNNKLRQAFNTWIVVPNDGGAALKAATGAWAGAPLSETVRNDIENTNIKQA